MTTEERIEEYVDNYVILNGLDEKGIVHLKQLVKDVCTECVKNEVADLEKENAELEEEMKAKQVVLNDFKSRVETVTDKFNKKSSQLTKAKEIIKKLIEAIHIWDCKNLEEVETEAEQFLKEVEK